MQPTFFDYDDRLALLEKLGDPLPRLSRSVDWESFRPEFKGLYKDQTNKQGGRPLYDPVLMFKILVLQQFYNLSDDQTEFQIRDRYSFCHFLGLTPESRIPDAKTIWVFRERLIAAGTLGKLFDQLLSQINASGFTPQKGQIVDAALVPAPRQRNSREENAQIKEGTPPTEWDKAKRQQKDTDARWTKKHGQNHFGYKNHLSIDRKHKVIRKYRVSSAEVHDSQLLVELLDETNSSGAVWADSAYRSEAMEESLKAAGYRSHIHRKAQKNKPLSQRSQEANRKKSTQRARVEHVFAQQTKRIVRTIGKARSEFKVGMMNVLYNMRRYAFLLG